MVIDLGWVDIALAAFLTLSVVVGLVRGFVFELLSLLGWFAAFFAGRWLAPMVLPYIHVGVPGSSLNYGAAFALVFLIALVVWSLAARLVRALIRATPLSLIDRLLGAGFGLLRGLVVLLLVVAAVTVSPLAKAAAWQRSQGAVWLHALLQELRPVFTDNVSQHLSA
ncbi:MAG: CvpA family protein [Burkholderiales bacterium]|nr:CvpA family protein [Burkholderiales bacterium]MDE2626881.1 CvpA family protein [Burkholderiales bacterium]